ncbi:hypothetical protein DIPPA_31898 [Diplonema papillatum]|nr:hypothetical protein DIPPA_31898 [Diplonema papillatum]
MAIRRSLALAARSGNLAYHESEIKGAFGELGDKILGAQTPVKTEGSLGGSYNVSRVGIRMNSETGVVTVRPPTTVLPPKSWIGYHAPSRSLDIKALRDWYFRAAGGWKSLIPQATGDGFQTKPGATAKMVKTFEEECGMLITYTKRPRTARGVLAADGVCSNEVLHNGSVVLNKPVPAKQKRSRVERAQGAEGAQADKDMPAEASNGAPRWLDSGYARLLVGRQGVTHEAVLQFFRSKLRVHDDDIGWHAVGDGIGRTTQYIFLRLSPTIHLGLVEELIGGHFVEQGILSVTEVVHTESTPPGKGSACLTVAIISEVSMPAASFAHEIDDFVALGRFVNFYPPTSFAAVRAPLVPLWVIGWHLCRFDDVHVAYSILAHEISCHFGSYRDLILIPTTEWHSDEAQERLASLESVLFRRRSSGAHRHLSVVLKHLSNKRGDVKGVTRALLNAAPHFVGICLAAFHKLVWNILASERLRYVKQPRIGDLAATEDGTVRVVTDPENHRITDIVYPVSHLLHDGSAASGSAPLLFPQHEFGRATVNKILTSFGLSPQDIKRLASYLPHRLLLVPYRRLVASLDGQVFIFTSSLFLPGVRPLSCRLSRHADLGLRRDSRYHTPESGPVAAPWRRSDVMQARTQYKGRGQKVWSSALATEKRKNLLDSLTEELARSGQLQGAALSQAQDRIRARIQSSSGKHASAWLYGNPGADTGLWLSSAELAVAVRLPVWGPATVAGS